MTTPQTVTWSPDRERVIGRCLSSLRKETLKDTQSENLALNKKSHPKEAELE